MALRESKEGVFALANSILYEIGTLTDFCINLLTKIGVYMKDAEIITDALMCAELRGIQSHGIVRLPIYIKRIETGVIVPEATMEFRKDCGATALLDANNGFGQVAGYKAMTYAINMAREFGIGMVGVKNSNHFGIASYYSMMTLKESMIGLVLTHASPAIAPFGTIKPLLGTNPLSVSIPANNEKPIILDMSMSTVARGKIRYSAMNNEKIPFGWGLDPEGNPTDDPNIALKGSLVPIGGVKGATLSLIIDILCGVLTDNSLTGEVKNINDMSGPSNTGHMFVAININNFVDAEHFKNNIDTIINSIKSLPSIEDKSVYMAGEIEYNLSENRKKQGIPVGENIIQILNQIAEHYKISKL